MRQNRNIIIIILLILFYCFVKIDCNKKLPSQFEASCFPGCHCSANLVECKNLEESNTELFRHILPIIYPDLDTLTVSGNHFGVLPNENIFGGNVRHKKLNYVNLTRNGITSIGQQTFIGIPRVEYLYLNDNELNSVGEKDQPFNFFTSLKLLDMTNVFGEHISIHARADLLRKIFRNNHSFVDLSEVILARNQLENIHEDTFCNIKGLSRLNLADNRLSTFDFKPECLADLRMLDLARNQFHQVRPTLWKSLPLLDTTDLSRNPLVCDCELEDFRKFAQSEINSFLNQEATTCAEPAQLAGKKIFEMAVDICRVSSGGGIWRWIFLIFLAIGVLIGYKYCRGNLQNRRSQMRIPLVVDGYSQLKQPNDDVAPAYV